MSERCDFSHAGQIDPSARGTRRFLLNADHEWFFFDYVPRRTMLSFHNHSFTWIVIFWWWKPKNHIVVAAFFSGGKLHLLNLERDTPKGGRMSDSIRREPARRDLTGRRSVLEVLSPTTAGLCHRGDSRVSRFVSCFFSRVSGLFSLHRLEILKCGPKGNERCDDPKVSVNDSINRENKWGDYPFSLFMRVHHACISRFYFLLFLRFSVLPFIHYFWLYFRVLFVWSLSVYSISAIYYNWHCNIKEFCTLCELCFSCPLALPSVSRFLLFFSLQTLIQISPSHSTSLSLSHII